MTCGYLLGLVEVVYLNTAHTNKVKPTKNNKHKQFKFDHDKNER